MRINVSEAYREEFEVFISEYQKLCDTIIDLVVDGTSVEKLITYCRFKHPDVMPRVTDTASSRDIIRGIVDKCSITNITNPLKGVVRHYYITGGERMIEDYQHSLDEYLLKLRARYLLGSPKDIFNAETIIFILDWTPDDTSSPHIKHLLYEVVGPLNKKIIVQATGKKILYLLNIYYNNTVITVPLLHVSCYGYFNLVHCFQFYTHTHTHTHTPASVFHCTLSLLLFACTNFSEFSDGSLKR